MRYMLLCSLLIVSLVPRSPAQIAEVPARGWIHLNGYSHHFAADDTNNNIFGVGVTWYTKTSGRFLRAWETDVFRDSGCKLSAHFGHSWTYRNRFVNLGATGSLMYHRNFAAHNRWRVLPVVLPYAETPFRRMLFRAYYIPPVRARADHQVALQVLVPFWR